MCSKQRKPILWVRSDQCWAPLKAIVARGAVGADHSVTFNGRVGGRTVIGMTRDALRRCGTWCVSIGVAAGALDAHVPASKRESIFWMPTCRDPLEVAMTAYTLC